MSINIGHTLAERADELGETQALVEAASGRSLSFRALNSRADGFATLLNEGGVTPGKRVMLMVKPSADFICLAFALFKIGAPVILIDPGMGYKNLLRCIEGVKPEYFVGIPQAQIFRLLFPNVFKSIKKSFCCGPSFGLLGPNIYKKVENWMQQYKAYSPQQNDLAALIFTTGSTGPPKGVRYGHSIFYAQLRHIREHYKIGPGDIDQPAFPLFALFSTALGAKAVIPDMDPTRPAQVNPERFVDSISKYAVTYSFGSPAIWKVIGTYCTAKDHRLQSLQKVLMAGAPVSGDLLARMYQVLPDSAEIHTPYGATESLPIVSIEGREVVQSTWEESKKGKGTCVGRSLAGIDIAIIAIDDLPIQSFAEVQLLEPNNIGEIIVRGDVVTKAYENNPDENALAKIDDGDTFWHRMGDCGYLDEVGRLWFCGRKAHRVVDNKTNTTWFSIPCESVFNLHSDIHRSALVGVYSKKRGTTIPVIVIEPEKNLSIQENALLKEAERLGCASPLTEAVEHYLIHPDFPVDIRHNAKIFREKLAVWAQEQLEALL